MTNIEEIRIQEFVYSTDKERYEHEDYMKSNGWKVQESGIKTIKNKLYPKGRTLPNLVFIKTIRSIDIDSLGRDI